MRSLRNNRGFLSGLLMAVLVIFLIVIAFKGIQYMDVATEKTTMEMSQLEAADKDTGAVLDTALNPQLGDSATITINAFDGAADSDTEIYPGLGIYDSISGEKYEDIDSYVTTSTMTTASVGDTIDIFGASNATIYCNPSYNNYINKRAKVIETSCYTEVGESNLAITGYDDNYNALSAGTNASEEDYDITIGADGNEIFIVRLKVNVANKVFPLKAFCLGASNDIQRTKFVGVEKETTEGWDIGDGKFKKVIMPLNISNDKVTDDSMNFEYDECYAYEGDVILMKEWDYIDFRYIMQAGSTDPTNVDGSDSDTSFIIFLDGGWDENSAGKITEANFYADTEDQENVGMIETVSSPVGKQNGVIIEGI